MLPPQASARFDGSKHSRRDATFEEWPAHLSAGTSTSRSGQWMPASSPRPSALPLVEQEVINVAAPHMGPSSAQMFQQVRVVAACLDKRVRQHPEPGIVQRPARHLPLLVDGLGQPDDTLGPLASLLTRT